MNTLLNPPTPTPETHSTREIAYWLTPDRFWTDDLAAAQTCDDYQVFATQSQRTHVPTHYSREQIEQHIRNLIEQPPCAQGHTGVDTPISTPTPCAQATQG
jgi:hypothetical protein